MSRSQHPRSRDSRTQKRSSAFWKVHVKAWRSSGLNRAEYCRRHSLSYDALTYWHSKTKCTDSQTAPCSIVPVLSIQTTDRPVHSPIRIRFREQLTIELEGEFDEAVLRKVIKVLEG